MTEQGRPRWFPVLTLQHGLSLVDTLPSGGGDRLDLSATCSLRCTRGSFLFPPAECQPMPCGTHLVTPTPASCNATPNGRPLLTTRSGTGAWCKKTAGLLATKDLKNSCQSPLLCTLRSLRGTTCPSNKTTGHTHASVRASARPTRSWLQPVGELAIRYLLFGIVWSATRFGKTVSVVLVRTVETPAPFFIEPGKMDLTWRSLHLASYPIAPQSKAAHYTRTWLEEGT